MSRTGNILEWNDLVADIPELQVCHHFNKKIVAIHSETLGRFQKFLICRKCNRVYVQTILPIVLSRRTNLNRTIPSVTLFCGRSRLSQIVYVMLTSGEEI